ncbi:MAG TPA: hypothetical protein VH436_03255 [Vicinamibacterales bacterium]
MSKILFVMLHPGFIRYYEDGLRALADEGHDVHVAFEITRSKLGEDVTARRLAECSPRITCGTTPERRESVRQFLVRGDRTALRSGDGRRTIRGEAREEAWESLGTTVRLGLDYLRFFEPAFAHASSLRERARKRLPRIYVSCIDTIARGGAMSRAALAGWLRFIERLIPTGAALDAFISEQNPDLLLVTPLVELGSQQVDYVKSARRLGVRSALCVASWDNLTSKGLIRVIPDHVIVWNESQKTEAVTMHGVAPEQVSVTGAQLFDRWFADRPSRSRGEFCRMVGLDPSRPFVLYVGSSTFIAPDEVPFAERWIGRIRKGAAEHVGVLIRPHPANSRQWRAFEAQSANVALWPPIGTDPTSPDFRRDYFDSLYYCAAVVGINTSAQIEAGIVGRPVFTIRSAEFAHAQQGTLHFQYLVNEGGAVRVADSLDEHAEQLAALLSGAPDAGRDAREFVRAFVRPHGLDTPVAPIFARAIGELARRSHPAPHRTDIVAVLLRPMARVMASVARMLAEDRPLWVYAMRPFIAAAVWTSAALYSVKRVSHELVHTGVKRCRRVAWHVWYESSRRAVRGARRVNKLFRTVRHAGAVAKRALLRAR